MKKKTVACLALVVVPALAVVVLASGGALTPQNAEDGFELAGDIEMVSAPNGLRTVVTVAPAGLYKPIRAFVLHHATPVSLTYGGTARLWFKPGVLTITVSDGRAWQFSVRRPGLFVPRAPAGAALLSVVGIASHEAAPGVIDVSQWASVLMGMISAPVDDAAGNVVVPPGSDSSPADCPDGAPQVCAGGGTGATQCSYSCAETSCSIACGEGFYACCWCHQSAVCACCPANPEP